MKIKPCPFCGCKTVDLLAETEYFPPVYVVKCGKCKAEGPYEYEDCDENAAIKKWNKRAKGDK